MYKAIVSFTDLQDNFYRYEIGDVYPREGAHVSESRIAELAGDGNKQKKPVIEMVGTAEKVDQLIEEITEEPKKRGKKKKNAD
mgnify:CR=1 FL=1